MKPVFEKHKPIIQVETWGTHKKIVEDFLVGLGYVQYHLDNNKLKQSVAGHDPSIVDFIFIHPQNQKAINLTRSLM